VVGIGVESRPQCWHAPVNGSAPASAPVNGDRAMDL
jgi:hypothetical protein